MVRLNIPRIELERLYTQERLSSGRIGRLLGCSDTTIRRRLHELGIAVRRRGSRPEYTVPAEVLNSWSPALAYVVGLIATDGHLDKERVRVEFVSKDRELIDLYCRALCLSEVHVVFNDRGSGRSWYSVKISDRIFRQFLERIGLTPVKSRTLGVLNVPKSVFPDFMRGVMDGDGSWYVIESHGGRYKYLRAELCSASLEFLSWVRNTVEELLGVHINIYSRRNGRAHFLQFTHPNALVLGQWIYYSPDVLALARKRRIWHAWNSKVGDSCDQPRI